MARQRDPWPPASGSGGVPEITVHQLQTRLAAGEKPVLLDVRQPWENQHADIEGSVLEPLNRLPEQLDRLRREIPESTPIVVFCHHGIRSLVGAGILLKAGFKNVVSLAGGIDAWSALIDPSVPRY